MNMHEKFAPSEKMMTAPMAPVRFAWLPSVRTRIATWLRAWADYFAAAAAYEDLSRLSDTQLKHRGLSRDILARDVSEGCDRGSGT
jgi:hypothetical protein